ncbi:MAG TPA: hypothetical protein VKA84_23515 [Gemmatimonadaceae bacterium]|nr:hypothetical protein [Gemmatimonadaceae bacterium]
MSEFQYYEFLAVDRPLTGPEMRALRAITSRAEITPTSLVNTYQWGDFKGNPTTLMRKYFDAFLYYANWGTHTLMLRLPRRLLDGKTASRYCAAESAAARVAGSHVILEFHSEDESGDWEGEPEGWLASIIPVRGELAAGDRRALYLAWLLCAQTGELRDTAREPPVPDGLGTLSSALSAFADFLRIDRELIAVAAERSAAPPTAPTRRKLRQWLQRLPPDERDTVLSRLVTGEDPGLRTELWREIARGEEPDDKRRASARESGPRTVATLLRAAAEQKQRRPGMRNTVRAADADE